MAARFSILITTMYILSCGQPAEPGSRQPEGASSGNATPQAQKASNCLTELKANNGEEDQVQIIDEQVSQISEGIDLSFDLAATVGFNESIKDLLKVQCGGCHNASLKPNTGDYTIVKSQISSILTRMKLSKGQKGVMPTAGPLAADKIKLLEDWQSGGMLEKLGTATTPTTSSSSDSTANAGCTKS